MPKLMKSVQTFVTRIVVNVVLYLASTNHKLGVFLIKVLLHQWTFDKFVIVLNMSIKIFYKELLIDLRLLLIYYWLEF